MIDISIIIPVYNVDNYIVRCLDSVFKQEFDGTFEVIAVDDCSTDNSLEKLKLYSEKEPGLQIINHAENKKLSLARNTGINAAKGNYIMHIDSDDWIEESTLQTLYNEIKRTAADVIVYDYFNFYDNNEIKYNNSIKENLFTDKKSQVKDCFLGTSVTKLVKRKLTKKLIVSEYSFNSGEDLIYCAEIFLKAKTFSLIKQPLYAYFQNLNSITHAVNNSEFLNSRLFLLERLNEIYKKHELNESFNSKVLEKMKKDIVLAVFRIWVSEFNFNKREFILRLKRLKGVDELFLITVERSMNSFMFSFYYMIKEFGIKRTFFNLFRN
ncbi:MAG: glycosyltransferase family 2 protein [Flavobacteriales bacterium]|nr:glycosyltransferase family 2 protein [Flavobacteriales bacterium]